MAVVLIVEDEALLGRNMKIFLNRQGFAAEHAETVAEGLRLYQTLQPDLVIVDHNLPDGTGLTLIETIRATDRWTKLVMITAHGGVELAVAAMKAGETRAGFGSAKRRIKIGGGDTSGLQLVNLVLHQSDERRNHDGQAGAVEGGYLEAKRFSTTGG